MKRLTAFIMLLMTNFAYGQVANDADGNFDSTTYVETNNTTATTSSSTSSSTSTNTNTNTNNNTNNTTINATNTNSNTNNNTNNTTINATNTNTNNNILSGGTNNTNRNYNNNTSISNNTNVSSSNNVNTNSNTNVSTATNTNNNTNVSTSTVDTTSNNTNTNNTVSDNTNTNINESTSVATNNNNNVNENRNTSVSESNQTQDINQKIESPPPSAIAPSIGSSYSQDLCTTGVAGAVQTQIFGLSAGKSVTDTNCERIKLSKTLYDMGMRVAAVSLMCQDERVWTAMKMAGTPCPYEGLIGDEAGAAWEENLADVPGVSERDVDRGRVTESPNGPRR